MMADQIVMVKHSFPRRWRETRQLVALNLVVKCRSLCEYLKVLYRYYRNWSFAKVDLTLLSQYLIKSPFAHSKEELQSRGDSDVYAYGETPLTTLDLIAQEAKITSSDTLFELGCGRGRSCFWLQKMIGCQVVGIDFVLAFIEKAERTQEICAVDDTEFRCEDFLKSDLTGATVVYLYGTCYGDKFLHELAERFEALPSGTRIITVSYPLTDYTDKPLFEVMKVFSAPFTWGTADVYIQYRL